MGEFLDQYCNMETGNYHQLVYPKQSKCIDDNIQWYLKWIFPISQTFTTDGCISGGLKSGFSLQSCKLGPCDSDNADDEEDDGQHREKNFDNEDDGEDRTTANKLTMSSLSSFRHDRLGRRGLRGDSN